MVVQLVFPWTLHMQCVCFTVLTFWNNRLYCCLMESLYFHCSLHCRCYPQQVGQQLPAVKVQEGEPGNKVAMDQLFKGKRGVLFAVPGAFTPGCSKVESSFLPVASCAQSTLQLLTFCLSCFFFISDSSPWFCAASWGSEEQRHRGDCLCFGQWRVRHGCLGERAWSRWQGMDRVFIPGANCCNLHQV